LVKIKSCYNETNRKQNERNKMSVKVLLVEDDNNLREIFEMRLKAEGYDTVTAGDGEEALVLAVKEKPNLIIADVMMPKLSGFEMVENMRASPELAKTKVIMMTALGQAEDRARGEKLGVVKYLVKSQVTLEDFARVVREVMPPDESGATATTAQPEMSAEPTIPTTSDPLNINKQESEMSMPDDTQPTPQTNPMPDAAGGAAPVGDNSAMPAADPAASPIADGAMPAGDAASSTPQTTAEETSAVQDQINNFENNPDAGTAPSVPGADTGAAPSVDGAMPAADPAMPVDSAMPAADPAAPSDSGAPVDSAMPGVVTPPVDPNAPAVGQAPEGATPTEQPGANNAL
jgi:CheY-like chemotaxis protein